MKSVYGNKHKIGIEVLLRWILITVIYYSIFILYATILISIRHFFKLNFTFLELKTNGWIIYFMFIAPGLNSTAHIIYTERGWLNYKAFIWLHTLWIVVFLPLAIFIF